GKLLHLALNFLSVHVRLGQQHFKVGADHAVAILIGRLVVAAGGRVLSDLAEDPGIGGGGAADHNSVAASLVDEGGGVFGRAHVSVADNGDGNCVLYGGDPLPARLTGVALLAGAGMQGDGSKAGLLRDAGQLHANDVVVVPAEANLDGERDGDGGADGLEDGRDE